MKKILTLLLLSVCTLTMRAQQVQQIADLPIDKAIPQVDLLMKDRIPDQVKLIGIGDIGTLVKETQQFDVNLSAWLISKKNLQLELAPLRADLTLLKWMMGILLAGVVSLVIKAFVHG